MTWCLNLIRNNNLFQSNKDDSSFRSNSITSRYNEEKMTFERLKKLAYKPYRPAPKLYYYYNPIEALRFEYQALVPQTNDFTPVRFNPALFRGYHGYGFNEWGGQGIV